MRVEAVGEQGLTLLRTTYTGGAPLLNPKTELRAMLIVLLLCAPGTLRLLSTLQVTVKVAV